MKLFIYYWFVMVGCVLERLSESSVEWDDEGRGAGADACCGDCKQWRTAH